MSWMIAGKELGRAREVLIKWTKEHDVRIAISDAGLRDPGLSASGGYENWLHDLLDNLNRSFQLPELFESVAKRLERDNHEHPGAKELRKIVEETRTAPAPAKPPERTPPPKLDRIILLGESTAGSPDSVKDSRKALHEQLTQAFKSKNLSILDWADYWNAGRAAAAKPEDARALFVRVVDTDILSDNLESLAALPDKLGVKLKLQGPLNPSQILIWNCDGVADGPKNGKGDAGEQEPDRDKIRARLDEKKLFLAEGMIDDLVKIVRSRLRLEKWPPVLRLEDPGNNKLIQKKLIDVILSSTRERCDPPYPQVLYLWGISGSNAGHTGGVMAEPKDLINDDASQDGLIIAIHDLNLTMTDDDRVAFWEFQQRLAQYDKLLTPLIRAKNIPDNKVVKLAIIMARSLPDDQFPYSYMFGDWTIAGMKKEKDDALLKSEDESKIKQKIDALLGAD
jgi:hypothetical protein